MLRSEFDREILRLAVPALGALAAEPLPALADTAIIGHLGTTELAALALAAALLTALFSLCIFLTYGTTAQVARLHGAGEQDRAGALAAQALWLGLGIGLALGATVAALAPQAIALMGGDGEVGDLAVRYLRIGALGVPAFMLILAGQGFLRGIGDLRRPLVILAAGNVANVVLNVALVYGADLGLDGSAIGTVIAQASMGAAFVVLLLRAPARTRRPRWSLMAPLVRMGGDLVVRTGALLGSFLVAGAVLARIGEASLGAHQVAFQLFVFLALVLDAIAIAGQVLVGRMLGAGDAGRAYAAARRMIELSVLAGVVLAVALLALTDLVPRAFTGDDAVIERAQAVWPLFALMQPFAGAVFALDGILIGAGDTRYLAISMVVAGFGFYVPIAVLALHLEWGIVGVWWGLVALMAVRLATLGLRFRSRRWARVGAEWPSPA
ncbi:MAG TPA: MATE family efflux transporter [Solirubrobacteraceae bacterium]|nr:MATE family efflux transporter [Solirubrobacteraceae bacterium]